MTKEELAQQLDGLEYPADPPRTLQVAAKESRLVVIYGAADDLMEFRGAIDDEIVAYEGTTALIDAQGLLPMRETSKDDTVLEEFFQRRKTAKTVKARWCVEANYSWTFETAIPHATFEITECGESYCRGIVIALDELGS